MERGDGSSRLRRLQHAIGEDGKSRTARGGELRSGIIVGAERRENAGLACVVERLDAGDRVVNQRGRIGRRVERQDARIGERLPT